MGSYVLVDRIGHTAIITLDHPPANTLSRALLSGLRHCLDELSGDSSVRSVVIAGRGESYFSAGLDIAALVEATRGEVEGLLDEFVALLESVRHFPGVTVAALNGYALGAGLELALACDYRVAEQGALMGMPEARLGLSPCGGSSRLLPDAVGMAWAKRLLLGGERISADLAWRIGLVDEAVESGFAKIVAISLANRVNRQGPQAVAVTRSLLEAGRDATLAEQLQRERAAFLALLGTNEQREGGQAFLEKRSPSWSDEEADEDNDE